MKQFIGLFVLGICTISNIFCKEDVLVDKVQQLTEWSLKKPIIRLNNDRFKHYVKNPPKNYSIIVMLTALSPQRQCGICQHANDEYEVVARSYRYSRAFSNKLFFAMVDFDEGAEVFQSLKLNSAPVFIHFPAKIKPKKADFMDVSRGFTAEHIAKWVNDRTDIHIQVFRPPNYSAFALLSGLIVIIAILLYVKRNSLEFIFNHFVCGVFIIGVICYFISGQTWNMINGPPFASNRKEGSGLFADDSNMQYVAETYIVFLLYFGVSMGMILLNEIPKFKLPGKTIKTILAIIGISIVICLFSYILSIFRAKYQGYPYSFLIK